MGGYFEKKNTFRFIKIQNQNIIFYFITHFKKVHYKLFIFYDLETDLDHLRRYFLYLSSDRVLRIFLFPYGSACIPYAFQMKNVFYQYVHCCCSRNQIYLVH